MKKTIQTKTRKDSHVICRGNQKVVRASREAIGAMKYKSE